MVGAWWVEVPRRSRANTEMRYCDTPGGVSGRDQGTVGKLSVRRSKIPKFPARLPWLRGGGGSPVAV
eukprot:6731560-Prymnesium_polylepis.1